MNKKLLLLIPVLSLALNACAPASSKNTYNGAAEQYACTTASGQIELTLTSTPLPSCVKLSDLPPEDVQLIANAAVAEAAKPAPELNTTGSILVDTTKL